MRVLVLAASPREDGNSRLLATALMEGAQDAGHETELADLNACMQGGFLRDCRRCRRPDGSCSIEDGYEALLRDRVAHADALVYATPLYWYGIAAVLKNFFDRMVCFTSGSYPAHAAMTAGLTNKRSALLISSEESYRGAALGVIAQMQEMSRYLHHELVGVVNGVGNKRGEVAADPSQPLAAARTLGQQLFDIRYSDYRVDSERANAVWAAKDGGVGVYEDV
jgi:multimeric flavodoxin WrbA